MFNAWEGFTARHTVGDVLDGRVARVVPFGAFIEVADGVHGLLVGSERPQAGLERLGTDRRDRPRQQTAEIDRELRLMARAVPPGPPHVLAAYRVIARPSANSRPYAS